METCLPARADARPYSLDALGEGGPDQLDTAIAMPAVTAVIPTFNEERNLPHVLPRLPGLVGEVIVVDGHSRDRTVEVAREVRPDTRIVYQSGRGKGNALACGFAEATGDIIVMLDADGSTDPAEIPRFVATLLTGAEFVKGSRFIPGVAAPTSRPCAGRGTGPCRAWSTCCSAPTTATSATAIPPSGDLPGPHGPRCRDRGLGSA